MIFQAFKDYYSGEHNRLLKMWREVVAVKRLFQDMQNSIRHQVGGMHIEMNGAVKELGTVCCNLSLIDQQTRKVNDEQLNYVNRENDDLQARFATLKIQHESARHEILERDQRLHELMSQLKKVEERCSQAEAQAVLANRYNEEIEHLNNSMREIAQAVLLDAELTDRESVANQQLSNLTEDLRPGQSKRDTSSSIISNRSKSPKRTVSRCCSQALAESTISAVQAALHKYQLALHDLHVQFQGTSENLRTTRGQLESNEATKCLLTTKVQQLTEKLDTSNQRLSELLRERDHLKSIFEETLKQKQQIEQSKADLNNAVSVIYLLIYF